MQCRRGEVENTHFRIDRYFCISGEWFFSTRENLQIGPFANKEDAQVELMLFLRHLREGGVFADRYRDLSYRTLERQW